MRIDGQEIVAVSGDQEVARGQDASPITTAAIQAAPDKGDVLISAGLYELSADTLFYLDPGEKNPFWTCIATHGKNIHIRGEGVGKTVLRLKPNQHYPDHPVATILAGPVTVTHDGGISQAILTSPALCEIDSIVVQCSEAPDGTVSLNVGWAADTDALMSNAEVPIILNGSKFNHPNTELTSATVIVATVGGSGTVGEWKVWVKYSEYSAS